MIDARARRCKLIGAGLTLLGTLSCAGFAVSSGGTQAAGIVLSLFCWMAGFGVFVAGRILE